MPPVLVRIPTAECIPHVLGAGLLADQQDFLAVCARSCRSWAVNAGLPTAAPGDAGSPLAMNGPLRLGIEHRMKKLVEAGRIDAEDGRLLVDQLFLHHVTAIFTAATVLRLPVRVCSM